MDSAHVCMHEASVYTLGIKVLCRDSKFLGCSAENEKNRCTKSSSEYWKRICGIRRVVERELYRHIEASTTTISASHPPP